MEYEVNPTVRHWESEFGWRYSKELDKLELACASRQTYLKQRALIIAICITEIFHNKFDFKAFWERSDLPSRNTYNKYRKADKYPDFVKVLDLLRTKCIDFKREQTARESERFRFEMQNQLMLSLHTLVEVRDDPDENGNVRVGAANSILDRHPDSAKVARQQISGDPQGGPVGIKSHDLTDEERDLEVQKMLLEQMAKLNAEGGET